MTLTKSIDNSNEFKSNVNKSINLDERTIELLFNSSPNYNLLYTNYSKPYENPIGLLLSFISSVQPIEIINFLYGSDFDVSLCSVTCNYLI